MDSGPCRDRLWQHPFSRASARDVTGGSTYLALSAGDRVGGGIVECGRLPPSWLPYARVGDVQRATDKACQLGASVLLAPREGAAGWRSVVSTPASGDLALWQPKAGWRR
jgi:predicted enzyme related to lactoylglutathione lyase